MLPAQLASKDCSRCKISIMTFQNPMPSRYLTRGMKENNSQSAVRTVVLPSQPWERLFLSNIGPGINNIIFTKNELLQIKLIYWSFWGWAGEEFQGHQYYYKKARRYPIGVLLDGKNHWRIDPLNFNIDYLFANLYSQLFSKSISIRSALLQ